MDQEMLEQLLNGFSEEVSAVERALRSRYESQIAVLTAKSKADLAAAKKETEKLREQMVRDAEERAVLRTQAEHAEDLRTRLANETAARATAEEQARAAREQLATRKEEPVVVQDDERLTAIARDVQAVPQLAETIARLSASVHALTSRPTPEPPTYEMRVTGRDGNNRPQSIRLQPVKKE